MNRYTQELNWYHNLELDKRKRLDLITDYALNLSDKYMGDLNAESLRRKSCSALEIKEFYQEEIRRTNEKILDFKLTETYAFHWLLSRMEFEIKAGAISGSLFHVPTMKIESYESIIKHLEDFETFIEVLTYSQYLLHLQYMLSSGILDQSGCKQINSAVEEDILRILTRQVIISCGLLDKYLAENNPEKNYPDKYYAWYHKIAIYLHKEQPIPTIEKKEAIKKIGSKYPVGTGFYKEMINCDFDNQEAVLQKDFAERWVGSLLDKDKQITDKGLPRWKQSIIEISGEDLSVIKFLRKFPN